MKKFLQVGVKAMVFNSKNELLLLNNNPEKYPDFQSWSIPGGRIEVGTSLEENLFREIFEETGILNSQIKINEIIGAQDIIKNDKHVVRITFSCSLLEDTKIKLSEEHNEYKFVSLEESLKIQNIDNYLYKLLMQKA